VDFAGASKENRSKQGTVPRKVVIIGGPASDLLQTTPHSYFYPKIST